MLINDSFYHKLTPDHQRMVMEAAVTARDTQRQSFRRDMATAKANCAKAGLHIDYLTDEDRIRMRQICQPIYDQATVLVGPKVMQELSQ